MPLVMLKFSKKPGDSLLLPIVTVSTIAFILQIIQITTSNLLIDKSNLVYITYILPIIFFSIITLAIVLDRTEINRQLNAK